MAEPSVPEMLEVRKSGYPKRESPTCKDLQPPAQVRLSKPEPLDGWTERPYGYAPAAQGLYGPLYFRAYYIHLLPENLVKNKGVDWDAFSGIIPEVEPWQD